MFRGLFSITVISIFSLFLKFKSSDGFIHLPYPTSCTKTLTTALNLKPSTYEQKLEEARLKKGKQTTSPSPIKPQSLRVVEEPILVKKAKASTNDLPFDDDMYDHLKYVISKVTSKLKHDQSLSAEELMRFKSSVRAIIADALGQEESQNDNEQPQNNSSIDEKVGEVDSQFEEFQGLKSTWEIKDSEEMTTEEYYSAVNQRIANIRSRRRAEGFGVSESDNYFDNLSKKP